MAETSPQSPPDTSPETSHDATPDTSPDTSPNTSPDTSSDTSSGPDQVASGDGLVSGPPHQPTAPTAATAAGEEPQGDPSCDHDWTVVNRDENRLVEKCPTCGAIRRE